MKSKIRNCIFILVLGISLGTILHILITAIPNTLAKNNLLESKGTICSEGYTYNPGLKNSGGIVDNFTDSIILFACVNDRQASIVEHSMNTVVVKNDPAVGLVNFLDGKKVLVDEYARYWHGYVVVLKPVLSLFNYEQVRVINICLQLLIVIAISTLLIRRRMFGFLIGYLLTYISISPLAVGMSLQYSSVFYIANIAIYVILWRPEWVRKYNLEMFLSIGMLTSYLDLLTYPIFTLGLPLVFVLAMKDNDGWNMKDILLNSTVWSCGYGAMWVSKWLIGSVLLGRNVLSNAVDAVSDRAGNQSGMYKIVFTEIFSECFKEIIIWKYLIIGIVVFAIVAIVERKIGLKKKYLLLISAFPFIWASVIQNHTFVHSWFVYRIFGIFILCIVSFIIYNIHNYIVQEIAMKKELNNTEEG